MSELFQIYPQLVGPKELRQFVDATCSLRSPADWGQEVQNGRRTTWQPARHGFTHPLFASFERRCRLLIQEEVIASAGTSMVRHTQGEFTAPRVDVRDEGRHVRCDLLLRPAARGGDFRIADTPVPLVAGDAVVYYPDVDEHKVVKVIAGARYALSCGSIFNGY